MQSTHNARIAQIFSALQVFNIKNILAFSQPYTN